MTINYDKYDRFFIKHNPDSTLQQEMNITNANNIGTNSQIKQIIAQIFSTISLTRSHHYYL